MEFCNLRTRWSGNRRMQRKCDFLCSTTPVVRRVDMSNHSYGGEVGHVLKSLDENSVLARMSQTMLMCFPVRCSASTEPTDLVVGTVEVRSGRTWYGAGLDSTEDKAVVSLIPPRTERIVGIVRRGWMWLVGCVSSTCRRMAVLRQRSGPRTWRLVGRLQGEGAGGPCLEQRQPMARSLAAAPNWIGCRVTLSNVSCHRAPPASSPTTSIHLFILRRHRLQPREQLCHIQAVLQLLRHFDSLTHLPTSLRVPLFRL
jgi:hypothetical protein